ncbi:hypothetical protein EHEL_091560 [Encephalitozoon hellem ATCC 50504]|uniref:DUF1686 domain-containing protein n=1 Tax=Encephalitozoon hellem TaxID=27973 RepID=A0A9Q9C3V6_ENCHE|nr:uncharacterized protein EHEL_091560 [Encephalitozoon hellem ATCC 50504]AFM99050.1 hypothetical protein EHEL_091560 [Encephalitozoon hellem ATCC 50504]UTX42455.1 DUF1686 domain-containing protein [Encephalitozoon hellem]UTX43676.1 DUF1686 domain-containing protein [Encephalitozoon hellem]|eukprot:XP_003888031.1 hypothetical protein EHEL_091560 [Encephalitozoon hellem ATCC 50504]
MESSDNSFQKRIENLFRVLIQRCLNDDGLLDLKTDIEKFASIYKDQTSNEQKESLNALVREIDHFISIVGNCKIQIPDVAAEEELLSKTLNDIFPELQSDDINSAARKIFNDIYNLNEEFGHSILQEEAENFSVSDFVSRKIQSFQDKLNEKLSNFVGHNEVIDAILGYYRKLKPSDLSQKAPTGTGIIERVIQKIKELGVGGILIGFIIVLVIQGILWATGQHDGVIGKAWSTTLYSVATIGAMLYLVWVAKKSYNSLDRAYSVITGEVTHGGIMEVLTNRETLTAIASMIPMVVGIPNMGTILSSIYGLTVAATSIVMIYVHNLSLTEMNLKEIGVVMVGNILVISLYLIGYKKSFEDDGYGPNYRMHIGMIIFVFLLLLLSFISKRKTNNTTEPGIKSHVVFTITLLVSTFVSFVAGREYRQLYGGVNGYESRTAA